MECEEDLVLRPDLPPRADAVTSFASVALFGIYKRSNDTRKNSEYKADASKVREIGD